MKTVLTLLASLTLFTTIASADHGCETPRRVVGYTRCGDPIIATYEYVGRDRCGDRVYQWVTHYPAERERETRIAIPMPESSLSLYFGAHAADRSRYYPSHDSRCR